MYLTDKEILETEKYIKELHAREDQNDSSNDKVEQKPHSLSKFAEETGNFK